MCRDRTVRGWGLHDDPVSAASGGKVQVSIGEQQCAPGLGSGAGVCPCSFSPSPSPKRGGEGRMPWITPARSVLAGRATVQRFASLTTASASNCSRVRRQRSPGARPGGFQDGIMLAPGALFRPHLERSPWMRFNGAVDTDARVQRWLGHAVKHPWLERDSFSSNCHPAPTYRFAWDHCRRPAHPRIKSEGRPRRDHALGCDAALAVAGISLAP